MSNAELSKRDLSVLWHPCTQMKDHETLPVIPIKSGKGVWLEDFEGNRYLDAVSSWWVNIFGHCNPRINAALREQTEQLEHVILAGFTHETVIELSERLVEITPPGLDRCFYADNGSSAVEVALKMSFHYWLNTGNSNKTKFVSLANSYHGETIGALSVGNVELYTETYRPLLLETITAPSPDCFYREAGESWHDYSLRQFDKMEAILEKQADEICAVIVEPLVQCAGHMRMYHPVYLQKLRAACDRYNVHLIADEVAVGFGRTGTLFACEQADISPDFICLSKGLTAGYLPLSVVLTGNKVYDAFYDDYANLTAFLHSHSYTGNPLGCRVAIETLNIFRDDPVLARNRELSALMAKHAEKFSDHPYIGDIRQTGMILAMEMVSDRNNKTPFDWKERRGLRAYRHAIDKGVLLRPLGNVMYFMPPYVISEDEIELMFSVAAESIDIATRGG